MDTVERLKEHGLFHFFEKKENIYNFIFLKEEGKFEPYRIDFVAIMDFFSAKKNKIEKDVLKNILRDNLYSFFEEKNIYVENIGKDIVDRVFVEDNRFLYRRMISTGSSCLPHHYRIPETLWTYSLFANSSFFSGEKAIRLVPFFGKKPFDENLCFFDPRNKQSVYEAYDFIYENSYEKVFSYVDVAAVFFNEVLVSGNDIRRMKRLVVTGNHCFGFYMDIFSKFFNLVYDSCKVYDGGLFFKRLVGKGNYEINDLFCIVEVENNKIKVTDLLNYCTPFIKYETGDYLKKEGEAVVYIGKYTLEEMNRINEIGKDMVDAGADDILFSLNGNDFFCGSNRKISKIISGMNFIEKKNRCVKLKHSFLGGHK